MEIETTLKEALLELTLMTGAAAADVVVVDGGGGDEHGNVVEFVVPFYSPCWPIVSKSLPCKLANVVDNFEKKTISCQTKKENL